MTNAVRECGLRKNTGHMNKKIRLRPKKEGVGKENLPSRREERRRRHPIAKRGMRLKKKKESRG